MQAGGFLRPRKPFVFGLFQGFCDLEIGRPFFSASEGIPVSHGYSEGHEGGIEGLEGHFEGSSCRKGGEITMRREVPHPPPSWKRREGGRGTGHSGGDARPRIPIISLFLDVGKRISGKRSDE